MRSVGANALGKLGVEAWGLIDMRGSEEVMADYQPFIQPLKSFPIQHGINVPDILAHSLHRGGGKGFAVCRESNLQSRNALGTKKQSEILREVVVYVNRHVQAGG